MAVSETPYLIRPSFQDPSGSINKCPWLVYSFLAFFRSGYRSMLWVSRMDYSKSYARGNSFPLVFPPRV